jgi:hypothetical protein
MQRIANAKKTRNKVEQNASAGKFPWNALRWEEQDLFMGKIGENWGGDCKTPATSKHSTKSV